MAMPNKSIFYDLIYDSFFSNGFVNNYACVLLTGDKNKPKITTVFSSWFGTKS